MVAESAVADQVAAPTATVADSSVATAAVASVAEFALAPAAESVTESVTESGTATGSAALPVQKSATATADTSQRSGRQVLRDKREPGSRRATRMRSLAWLSTQNPGHYTLQLAPAGGKVDLFLIADNLPVMTDQLTTASGTRLLLHGSFSNRSSAQLAMMEIIESVAGLPQIAPLLEPQILSFGEIRQRLQ